MSDTDVAVVDKKPPVIVNSVKEALIKYLGKESRQCVKVFPVGERHFRVNWVLSDSGRMVRSAFYRAEFVQGKLVATPRSGVSATM